MHLQQQSGSKAGNGDSCSDEGGADGTPAAQQALAAAPAPQASTFPTPAAAQQLLAQRWEKLLGSCRSRGGTGLWCWSCR